VTYWPECGTNVIHLFIFRFNFAGELIVNYFLQILILTENSITRLEGLEGLPKLQKLVLDKNKIKSVDESSVTVANLPHLSVLHLEYLFY
jgi:Leucine-rich repeat (LRR) protein